MKNRKRSYAMPWWVDGEAVVPLEMLLSFVLVCLIEWLQPSVEVAEVFGWTENPVSNAAPMVLAGRLGILIIGSFLIVERIRQRVELWRMRRNWIAITSHRFDPRELENDLYRFAGVVGGDNERLRLFWFLHEMAYRLGHLPRHNRFGDYAPKDQ